MKPEMMVTKVMTSQIMTPGSPGNPNAQADPTQNTAAESVDAKYRDEDYESTTWSDGGLW